MTDAAKKAERIAADVEEAIREAHGKKLTIDIEPFGVGERMGPLGTQRDGAQTPRPEAVRRLRVYLEPTPATAYAVVDTAIRAGAMLRLPSAPDLPGRVDSAIVYGVSNPAEMINQARLSALENALETAHATSGLVAKMAGDAVRIEAVRITRHRGALPDGLQDHVVETISSNSKLIKITCTLTVTCELIDLPE